MQTEYYKKQIIIAVSAGIVEMVVMTIIFYNTITHEDRSLNILPFILFLAAVFSFGFALNSTIKALNPRILKSHIDKAVNEERIRILKEFENKEEDETLQKDEDESIQDRIKGILPKGNLKSIDSFIEKLLKNLVDHLEMMQGIAYLKDNESENYNFLKGFALTGDKEIPSFKKGESLNGQVVENKEVMVVNDIPEDYFEIESGLGQSKPKQIIIVPVLVKDDVIAVLEMSSFKQIEGLKEIMGVLGSEISTKLEQIIKS